MTEAEVQRLRDAGISDAVIMELQQEQEKKTTGTTSLAPAGGKSELPEVNPNTPSQVYQNAQASGVPTQGQGPGATQTALEIGTVVAPYALPAAGAAVAGGAGYGLYKFGKGVLDTGRDVTAAMRERTAFEAARESRIANRPGMGGAPAAGSAPVAPTAPAAAPAPAAPAPAAQQPGIVQRGMDMANKVRQVAMDRVITPAMEAAPRVAQAAAPVARAAGGITAAVMPGNVGQNYPFPMSGPMRGQEINPKTGAPWTPQELTAYRAQYGS